MGGEVQEEEALVSHEEDEKRRRCRLKIVLGIAFRVVEQ